MADRGRSDYGLVHWTSVAPHGTEAPSSTRTKCRLHPHNPVIVTSGPNRQALRICSILAPRGSGKTNGGPSKSRTTTLCWASECMQDTNRGVWGDNTHGTRGSPANAVPPSFGSLCIANGGHDHPLEVVPPEHGAISYQINSLT